jgi:hypothetical protein
MPDILRKFTMCFHVAGTMAADLDIRWTVPSDCTLRGVSAVTSNDSDATFTLGTSAAATAYLTAQVFGDSNTPAQYELADFDGTTIGTQGKDYPHITDGTIMVLAVDYDGATGTAGDDPTIVLTFAEG